MTACCIACVLRVWAVQFLHALTSTKKVLTWLTRGLAYDLGPGLSRIPKPYCKSHK